MVDLLMKVYLRYLLKCGESSLINKRTVKENKNLISPFLIVGIRGGARGTKEFYPNPVYTKIMLHIQRLNYFLK